MSDPVNHPPHYADGWSNGAEIIDITEHLNYCRGNAVKYIVRAGRKDPGKELEDLRKAAWHINREINRISNPTNGPDSVVIPLRREPRVWDYLEDVPTDVAVTDNDGDRTEFRYGHRHYRSGQLSGWSGAIDPANWDAGPYEEIIA